MKIIVFTVAFITLSIGMSGTIIRNPEIALCRTYLACASLIALAIAVHEREV